VPAGDILALVGPSGCGKTTLLRLIAGFERLDGGAVEIDGQVMADGTRHVPPERRRVGMVFQDYAVFPHLSVGRNVGFALGKGEPARARVAELLDFVGLAGRENAMPHELSGGEQQRLVGARPVRGRRCCCSMSRSLTDAALRGEVRDRCGRCCETGGHGRLCHPIRMRRCPGRPGSRHGAGLEQIDMPEAIFHRPQTLCGQILGHTKFVCQTTAAGIGTPLGIGAAWCCPRGDSGGRRPSDDVTFHADAAGLSRIVAATSLYNTIPPEFCPTGSSHSWQPHEVRLAEGRRSPRNFRATQPPCLFLRGLAV
jgi:iron(III) transport system ATP-binding protein